jgi:hypothetical protein
VCFDRLCRFFFFDFFSAQHNEFTFDTALEMRSVFYQTIALVSGIAMIVGGIAGSWKTIVRMFEE